MNQRKFQYRAVFLNVDKKPDTAIEFDATGMDAASKRFIRELSKRIGGYVVGGYLERVRFLDCPPLTEEQQRAIREFAAIHGKGWKQTLTEQWWSASASPLLHGLRNSHGPAWLLDYKLEE
jgi:hypothetical protein